MGLPLIYTSGVLRTGDVGSLLPDGDDETDCFYLVEHTEVGTYDNEACVTIEDDEENPADDCDDATVEVWDGAGWQTVWTAPSSTVQTSSPRPAITATS